MRDIRHALRVLLASPAVTFTALSILALGIGTTAAIFTVTSRVLFRPLPFAAPERLVHFGTLGILELRQYRERSRSFDSVVSYSWSTGISRMSRRPNGSARWQPSPGCSTCWVFRRSPAARSAVPIRQQWP